MIILETERLLLRQFHIFDGEALECVFGDPEVMHFGPGVQTRSWIHDWLHACLDNYQKFGFGVWAVVERTSKVIIGYAGLFHFPEIDGQPEIEVGYRLARRCWGQGFATEAATAIRDYAFDVLSLPRLVALIDPHNSASIRVVEKIGMRYEKDVMLERYTHPDHLYSMMNPTRKEESGKIKNS
jgi:ribosomal-protein-alanine N-acetyltransferase